MSNIQTYLFFASITFGKCVASSENYLPPLRATDIIYAKKFASNFFFAVQLSLLLSSLFLRRRFSSFDFSFSKAEDVASLSKLPSLSKEKKNGERRSLCGCCNCSSPCSSLRFCNLHAWQQERQKLQIFVFLLSVHLISEQKVIVKGTKITYFALMFTMTPSSGNSGYCHARKADNTWFPKKRTRRKAKNVLFAAMSYQKNIPLSRSLCGAEARLAFSCISAGGGGGGKGRK